MPREDFADTPDGQAFSALPAGEYLSAVEKIRERATTKGDLMWGVQFDVVEGEHKGRKLFDNIIFSDAAAWRRKIIFSRLGLDVSQPFDVEPHDIMGKKVYLTVTKGEYEGKPKNDVTPDGYRRLGGDEPEFDMPDEGLAF